jgi:DNA repair protein RecN (Recombination protein N)
MDMITTLHIKNIGIIDDIVIDLNKGLNVLTGETGAGKTLIVDSLGIIAGGRFSKDMIRRGQSMSFVELALYLPENPNSIDGNVVVSREIRLVPVSELKNFMKNIIDIHGQYDNQTLMDTEFHTRYLDKFVGEKMFKIHEKYCELYNEYVELNKKLKNNYGDEIEKQRKLDLLEYQYKEIKSANLKRGEDEQLEEKRKIIMSSEKVAESLNNVSNNLEGTIIDVINDSIRALEKIEDVNSKYGEKLVEMKNIYYEVQEVARDISSMKEDVYFDEEERNEIEERLDEIYSLKENMVIQ